MCPTPRNVKDRQVTKEMEPSHRGRVREMETGRERGRKGNGRGRYREGVGERGRERGRDRLRKCETDRGERERGV